MRQELDKILCEKYPKIFKDRYGDKMSTAMCWGFSHGDGWFDLLDNLCWVIQERIDNRKTQIEWCITNGKERPEEIPQVVAVQVKEKYGTLRFYYDGGDDYIAGAVDLAETMSSCTCEECGAPGHKRGGGWIRTLCDNHYEQKESTVEHHPV
ncbi:MAG: hypothetical protein EBU90_14010 [Proteobacteria bacterium]|nr:hypothetical protein [Pseudomonadota bacterium]